MSQSRNLLIGIAVLVVIGFIIIGVPFIEVEIQIPYTETETLQETIGSVTSRTLEAGYYLHWNEYLDRGKDISFSFSASDTVNAFILTPSQYNDFQDEGLYPEYYEKRLLEVESGMIGYYIPASDTYYFILANIHTGFWGFGEKDIVINRCAIIASWEEEVTKYRTETEKITIIEYLMGDY